MSATVGAALKKIAVALLTNSKVLKTIGGIALGIIIILVMSLVAILTIFSGDFEIDTNALSTRIEQNISEEQASQLQIYTDTMTEIEKQLDKKELSNCNTQAEVIYIMALSDKSDSENFVKDFVSCFKKNQNDEDLIKRMSENLLI